MLAAKKSPADKLRSAHILLKRGEVDHARHNLQVLASELKSTPLAPIYAETLLLLGDAARLKGDYNNAYRYFINALGRDKKLFNNIPKGTLFTCLARITYIPAESPIVDRHIRQYLEHPMTINKNIEGLTVGFLLQRYGINAGMFDDTIIDLAELSSDITLHLAMSNLMLPNRTMELMLTAVRKELLAQCLSGDMDPAWVELISAFARRVSSNEYINPVSDVEQNILNELLNILELPTSPTPEDISKVRYDLMLLAMYLPFSQLRQADGLLAVPSALWPEELRCIARETLFEPAEEQRVLKEIQPLMVGSDQIADLTSKKVRRQYEESPYPRWKSLGLLTTKKHYFEHYAYLADQPLFSQTPHQKIYKTLVAGCGTGEHPMQIASALNNLQITAIDLSIRSLAYAELKRRQYNINSVEFFQADILELNDSVKKFDIIESLGVLHHLNEPEEGLTSLLKVLNPDGILMVGLYSKLARQPFEQLRCANQKLSADREKILSLRQKILNDQTAVTAWADGALDFYSYSSLRDLLFHVQEHQYTIPMIGEILDKFQLRFLGFCLPQSVKSRYLKIFPSDSKLTNLDNWHQYEQQHPTTFLAMYNFHCTRLQ